MPRYDADLGRDVPSEVDKLTHYVSEVEHHVELMRAEVKDGWAVQDARSELRLGSIQSSIKGLQAVLVLCLAVLISIAVRLWFF